MSDAGKPREGEQERDARAEELLDPLFITVDVLVYSAMLGAPVLLMLLFGRWWALACVAGLIAAACCSARIARPIVTVLRRWLGR